MHPAANRPHTGGYHPPTPMRRRRAFTLVELLVVIAIIGVLIALLLPAVQAAREAARRSQCRSQLRQLAIGALNHHDTHNFFPTGGWGWGYVGDPDWGYAADQPGGWAFNILPYIEEQSLHDTGASGQRIDTGQALRDQKTAGQIVAMAPITIINCPSRRPATVYPRGGGALRNAITPAMTGRTDYAMNAGHGPAAEFTGGVSSGPGSYKASDIATWNNNVDNLLAAEANTNAERPWVDSGISFGRSKVGFRRISDGSSHTYLIGEKMLPVADYETGSHPSDNETWCTGFNNDNCRITARWTDADEDNVLLPAPDTSTDPDAIARAASTFGSAHSGVWQAAMCDGSVHAYSYSIDWQAHRDLGSRADGNTINAGDL